MLFDIGNTTQVPIMKNDDLIVAGEMDIQFYEIGGMEGGYYGLLGVLGEDRAQAAMGDYCSCVGMGGL